MVSNVGLGRRIPIHEEDALRSQRDLYEALLRAESDLGQGVVLTKFDAGREQRPAYVNEAFARMTGRSADELVSPSFDVRTILDPQQTARLAREIDLTDPSSTRHYETAIVRPDGSTLRIDVTSVGVTIDGERYRLALVRDVTSERRVEDERRARETFLKDATLQLLEASLDPEETLVVTTRLATRHLADVAVVDLLVGDEGLRRLAATPAEEALAPLVGRYHEVFPPTRTVRALIESIPRGDAMLTHESPDAHGPTQLRHVLLIPLVARAGVVGALGLARSRETPFDAEEVFVAKSLAARCALAYENARLYAHHQRILDTAPAQILTIDESGRILSLNRSVRAMEVRAAMGLNAFDTIVPEDRERVKGLVLAAMRSGTPCEYETRAQVGPGEARWFQVRVGPLDLGGRPGAILISTDVHDRKRIEQEIAEARAQLIRGERLSALGGLVSGVAHELRTPLTYLSNNAFLLELRLMQAAKEGTSASATLESVKPFVQEIKAGVDRIDQLVEDLRKYTRGKQTESFEEAGLDLFLTEAIEIFRAASRGSHPVEQALSPTLPVRANRGAVQQLVLNLLQNAGDASPPGSTIRIGTRQDGDRAVLEVSDRGIGIPDEVRARMFEPLFTTKPEGTGLGLTIVKRIADEHRAAIQVETTLGRGTAFRVLFPTRS